jgi:hypothetical protein
MLRNIVQISVIKYFLEIRAKQFLPGSKGVGEEREVAGEGRRGEK